MIIGNGSFIAHPRITNPTDKDLRGYWWTCVAVGTIIDAVHVMSSSDCHLLTALSFPEWRFYDRQLYVDSLKDL